MPTIVHILNKGVPPLLQGCPLQMIPKDFKFLTKSLDLL